MTEKISYKSDLDKLSEALIDPLSKYSEDRTVTGEFLIDEWVYSARPSLNLIKTLIKTDNCFATASMWSYSLEDEIEWNR